MLAVYVHHDKSVQSNVFCSQLLCADSIVSFLNQNFVTWAWDVTSLKNRERSVADFVQMKSFIAKRVKSILVNFRYLRFKLLKYKENNKKICDTFDHNFRYIPLCVMS